jgi:uncharacterized membrane protein YfcA
MDLTPLYVVLGAAAAGFVQGLSGFAFGLVASAVWAWVVAPQLAGPMVVFGSLLGQILSIGALRRSFDLRRVLPFVVAGLLGVPIGVVLLKNLDQTIFRLVVGVILLVSCTAMLLIRNRAPVKGGGRFADAAVGFVGGVMGGVAGLSGPAPTLWCALRGWKKDVQRAVYQSFNLVMHAATFAVYTASGLINGRSAWMLALVAPAMVIPSLLGTRLYNRINETAFRRLVLVLAGMSGLALILAAVEQLTRGHR